MNYSNVDSVLQCATSSVETKEIMDDVCVCTKMTCEMGQFVQFILTEIHANNSYTIILFFIELSNLLYYYAAYKN